MLGTVLSLKQIQQPYTHSYTQMCQKYPTPLHVSMHHNKRSAAFGFCTSHGEGCAVIVAERRGSGNVGWIMAGHGPATTVSRNEATTNGSIEPFVSQQPSQPFSSRTTVPSYSQGGVPPVGGMHHHVYTPHTQYSVVHRSLTAILCNPAWFHARPQCLRLLGAFSA